MIKKKLMLFIAFIFTAVPMLSAYAATGVYDEAGVLFETDVTELESEAAGLYELTGWDTIVATTSDAQGKTSMEYADDYYDGLECGENGILFLLDMDNMEIYISTSGEAVEYINDSRIDSILNASAEYASAGNYYMAISTEISMTADYYNAGIPVDQADMASRLGVVIAGLIVGLITAGIFVSSTLKSYGFKEVGNIYDYSKSQMRLSENSDTLVNSFVTTRVRPRQQSSGSSRSGGGSRTHVSSSGRTHGGGGRKF